MSSGSGTNVDGVLRNSALAFVAPTQPQTNSSQGSQDQMDPSDRLMPAGLKALYEACSKIYPDQPNPLQVTTRLKYWLGGQDPLDYISMYWNPGIPEENIPPHWHYVSFGVSDLHGDGRVHPMPELGDKWSGYGLELTLRLASDRSQSPPVWPAALLQALARYIFTTGNKFCAGDHISWHAALDGSQSRVRHLLVAEDPQLHTVNTPHGDVIFLQMVGCTTRELRAAQRGSGFEVLKLISEDPRCGGEWLVTQVSRRRSARLAICNRQLVHLAGVSARVNWQKYCLSEEEQPLSPSVERQIKETLQRGLSSMTDRGSEGHNMSTDSFEMSSMERALPQIPNIVQESWREESIEYLEGVHLMLNSEGASLLPLAIDGRVRHSSHFTWRQGARSVTVLPPSVGGAFVTPRRPYAVSGSWLQILIPKELAEEMSKKVAPLANLAEMDSETDEDENQDATTAPSIPYTISWPSYKLKISVLPDTDFL
ncbi:suppressor of fused homolog [Pieris brassicae]|uniref:suppressor of fused homolog n=1 Tax=Pieris brassicae TaxID=7116 RepID=UPI001E662031|nr:suppressor of fused homolog [Pieris brassicae]